MNSKRGHSAFASNNSITPSDRSRGFFALGLFALIVVHLFLVVDGARRHSAVFDEVVYPTTGYAYLTTGDYRLNQEHPPLLKLWTGAAWLGTGLNVRAVPGWLEGDQWEFGRDLLYRSGLSPRALLLRARWMIALLSAGMLAAVAWVSYRLEGAAAGLAAAALCAFDPLVIAHAGFATTDLGSAALHFVAVAAVVPAVRLGGNRRVGLAGLAGGAAAAAKFSVLTWVPAAAVAAAVPAKEKGGARGRWVALTVVGAAAALVVAVTYGPAGPGRYLHGLYMLVYHGEVGHPAYAFGRYASHGWWWYFPAAWAVKTPIPVLALTLPGIALLARRRGRGIALRWVILTALLLQIAAALLSPLDIGVRHLLPATPLLAVGGGLAAAELWKRKAGRVVVAILLLWLAAGTARVHPDEMAYSNEIAGGPGRTWRYLADSNVDWGQDLPALAREVHRHPLRRLYLGYFGTAEPDAYGLGDYCWIPSMRMVDRRFRDGPDPGGREWIALSVTNLLEVYSARHDAYAWLRARPMTAFPGHSVALYDITGDAGAHRRLGEVAIGFGDAEAAEPALRRAVELAPGDGRARLELARVLAARARWKEALAQCRTAAGLLPPGSAESVCEMIKRSAVGRR